jgi:ABC-type transport system substrate-binding protein
MISTSLFHVSVVGQEEKKYFFTINFMGWSGGLDVCDIIMNGWDEIGIRTELIIVDWSAKYARYTFADVPPGSTYEEGGNDICTSGWPSSPDPDTYSYYHTEAQTGRSAAASNSMMYSNGEVDRLLEAGVRTSDVSERIEIYQKIENIIHDEVPIIYTYRDPAIKATTANLDLGEARGLPATGLYDWAETFEFTDQTGGTMVFIGNEDLATLNPMFSSSTVVVNNMRLIHRRLLKDGLVFGTFEPDLAESYEISDDGKTYTFHLRENVKWHDGEDFTADDVMFSWGLYMNPEAGVINSGLWIKYVEDIAKVDEYTVQFTLHEPYAPALFAFGNDGNILPEHILGEVPVTQLREQPYNQMPVGTGPFMIVEWRPDEYIQYDAFEDFYLGKPKLDSIIFRPLPDYATGIVALEAGEVNLVEQQAYRTTIIANYDRLVDNPDVEVSVDPDNGVNLLIINMDNPILNNVNVRRAMATAIDIDAILEGPMKGLGVKTPQRYPPIMEQYYDTSITHYPYDIEAAKALMEKAGYDYDLLETPETPTTGYILPAAIGLIVGALLGVLIDRFVLKSS